jgi:localization factor PodJL
LAEIGERQRALDGHSSPALTGSEPLPRARTQEFSALEQQLREINRQIENIARPCGVDKAIDRLRDDLAEIGAMLQEVMPRKSVEALEQATLKLADRLDGGREAGVDASALGSVEKSLAELREAVRGLGKIDTLSNLDHALQELSRKVDGIAQKSEQPGALRGIESALATMRSSVSHVASNDALAKLSDEVRALAAKLDRTASAVSGETLATLEKRIAALSDALHARNQAGQSVPAELKALLEALAEKIERVQLTAQGDDTGALSRELGELKQTEKKTRESLEVVHGTLGHVVDRLAMIETDMRSNARARSRGAKTKTAGTQTDIHEPASQASQAPTELPVHASENEAQAASGAGAVETFPTPDHPLEPGTGRMPESPAERIEASEAALEEVTTAAVPEPVGKSDFIAAARRAAQTAARQTSSKNTSTRANDIASAAGKLAKRVGKLRALIAGSSAILLVLGSLELARTLLSSSPDAEGGAPVAQTTLAQMQTEAATPASEPERIPVSANVNRDVAASERDPAASEPPTLPTGVASRPASMINLPLEIARQASTGMHPTRTEPPAEVTGSIPPAASAPTAGTATAPLNAPTTPSHAGDSLPAGLGPNLRAAALKGEAAAEYEVAVRLAEGKGVPQNLSSAFEWFERAAKKGMAPAQFRLAGLYEKGLGVKKNLETVRRYYSAAGEAGHAKALHNLAVLYAEAIDGRPDYQSAAKWFRKAAAYGVTDSQYNLAVLYARGIGVEQNLAEAYKWFALAARDGDVESARKRDELAAHLDQRSLQVALQAAQTFVPQQQPEAAVLVKTPAGGWDPVNTSSTLPPPKRKPHVVGPKLDLATPIPPQ